MLAEAANQTTASSRMCLAESSQVVVKYCLPEMEQEKRTSLSQVLKNTKDDSGM